ncbi:MAG TPA: TolC family protein [Cyclobacteriaceae bacterium]|nr:TolC family protein [Cyclobacteriaceae bacterium]
MKNLTLLVILFLTSLISKAQQTELTLEECYSQAEQNYPLVKQRELLTKSKEYSIDNISKGNLPQIIIAGQASYQSAVTQIPIKIPNQDVPQIPKDQYKLYGEISQPLTDLVTVNRQKEAQEINSMIQQQNLEVELYKLKDRINQLYFGALLIDEQYNQNELLKKDIQTGIDKTSASLANGNEFKSSVDKLKAELLRANQRSIELRASRKAYVDMLGLFINKVLDENIALHKPNTIVTQETINRPELKLYDYQKQSYDVQNKLISTRNMPKFSLFFQGGLGQPSPVNMLSNKLSTYYIGGLRLNWALTSFYTSNKERQIIAINQNIISTQRETFLFNTNITLKQQNSEINKLQQLIAADDEIIVLRESVKEASNAQLENGVITVNDFLREVNAEDQARQNKLLHETQLLMAQYNYQTTAGIN